MQRDNKYGEISSKIGDFVSLRVYIAVCDNFWLKLSAEIVKYTAMRSWAYGLNDPVLLSIRANVQPRTNCFSYIYKDLSNK